MPVIAPDDPGPVATLVQWLRPDGAVVGVDDPICEIATGNASLDLAAWADGAPRHLARPGDRVSADVPVARIDPVG